jgi:hypothetical protein
VPIMEAPLHRHPHAGLFRPVPGRLVGGFPGSVEIRYLSPCSLGWLQSHDVRQPRFPQRAFKGRALAVRAVGDDGAERQSQRQGGVNSRPPDLGLGAEGPTRSEFNKVTLAASPGCISPRPIVRCS